MRHYGTRELTTENLVLRKFALNDAEPMFSNWANDAKVTKFLSWNVHKDITVTVAVIESWLADYSKPDFYNWAIVCRGEVIGSISMFNIDETVETAEIGYCLSQSYWGKGIMPEALSAVIDYAFIQIGFSRLYAKHDLYNPNSGKVMKKCGMGYIFTREYEIPRNPPRKALCAVYRIDNPTLNR